MSVETNPPETEGNNNPPPIPKPNEPVVDYKAQLDALRAQHSEILDRYKDIDPVKAKENADKIAEIERLELEKKGEWEELKTRSAAERAEAVAAVETSYKEKLSKRDEALRQVLIEKQISEEFAAQKGKAASAALFASNAAKYVDLSFDGDEISVVIKDSAKGASIKELVTNLKNSEEFGVFFSADIPAGSGTGTNRRASSDAPAGTLQRSKMSVKEKSKYVSENGAQVRKNPNVPSYNELPF